MATDLDMRLDGWQPMETAPKGEVILGLKFNGGQGSQPVICGELYDERLAGGPALIDRWLGRWARVSHWMPIPALHTVHEGCRNCEGSGWVCENHPCIAWHGLAGKIRCCGGAGMPCPVCDNQPAPEASRA